MTRQHTLRLPLLLAAVGLLASATEASIFVAYSLRVAEQQLRASRPTDTVLTLGGMTHPAGMVFDADSGDLILVGELRGGEPPVMLDDLVVALRARLIHKRWPEVSIDRTPETSKTNRQTVRFEGGIANTGLGKDLFLADVLLKEVALGLVTHNEVDLSSYFDLCLQKAEQAQSDKVITSQFWFYPLKVRLGERSGVFAIGALHVGVRTRLAGMSRQGEPLTDVSNERDEEGEAFAAALTELMPALRAAYPEVRRLHGIMALVALARGVESVSPTPDLRYWLEDYEVQRTHTPLEYELVRRHQEIGSVNGKRLVFELNGGIEAKAILSRLKHGSVTALRDAVLKSRPGQGALIWRVPLEGWRIPGAGEAVGEPPAELAALKALPQREIGCSLTRLLSEAGARQELRVPFPGRLSRPGMGLEPPFQLDSRLPWQGRIGQVGGVMLCNTARVEGLDGGTVSGAEVDPATGSFSLLVQGRNLEVRDADLREFVTALWAVYFSEEDPGISIDPISVESDCQLVRIIGNIADTKMANVLLDADYYMKQCAVGTRHPPIPGFKSVDELTGQAGVRILGAGRRFWFVPEDMAFRLCGGGLAFDGGRMTVKTEYLFLGDKSAKSEPADEVFAQFWTDHYWEFAAVNPVYEELFEYARLTALAKYLKQSGVNLQWFLLANRHLVLDAKTPGTVKTLRSPSKVLRGVQWVGGVDLGVNMARTEPGRYILDEAAARALTRQARLAAKDGRGGPAQAGSGVSTLGNQRFTVRLPEATYTVLPAIGASSGTGPGQVTYHTDLALRAGGEPGIELIRYNKPGGTGGLLGRCWDVYRPYALAPAGNKVKAAEVPVLTADEQVVTADLYVPESMLIVDQITEHRETLVLSKDRFDTVAWVPTDEKRSRFRGLACLNDGSYLLCEKSGCRLRFDGQARLADIYFSEHHGVSYEYQEGRIVAVRDTYGGQVDLAYDERGRVARASSGSEFAAYKYLGDELALVQYSDGRRLAMIYNEDGSLSEVVCKVPTTANAHPDATDTVALCSDE